MLPPKEGRKRRINQTQSEQREGNHKAEYGAN